MKYIILFLVIFSGCSANTIPRFKKGECFVVMHPESEEWENPHKIYDVKQVAEIGKNNYRVLLTYGSKDDYGNYELEEATFPFILANSEIHVSKCNCPKEIFGE